MGRQCGRKDHRQRRLQQDRRQGRDVGRAYQLGPMISTKIARAPAIMDQETRFLAALGDAGHWLVESQKASSSCSMPTAGQFPFSLERWVVSWNRNWFTNQFE